MVALLERDPENGKQEKKQCDKCDGRGEVKTFDGHRPEPGTRAAQAQAD